MPISWHPPIGVFIAILALLGVLVPLLRERIGRREKALWTLVMFALVGLEIRSIYLDRDEHDREQARVRTEELRRFEKIATGIENAITNSQRQFDATMDRTDKIINLERSTLDGVKRSLDEITGGNSFCYIEFHITQGYMFVRNMGAHPLYGVNARILDLHKLEILKKAPNPTIDEIMFMDTNIVIGDLPANTYIQVKNPILSNYQKEANFDIRFNARNGFWTQFYRLRFIEGRWVAATKVIRDVPGEGKITLYEKIEYQFPRNKTGKVDW